MSGRRFELHRDRDVSGVSGVGVVADGLEFPDGAAVIRWRGNVPSTTVHELGVIGVQQIHGHGGATRLVWLDDDGPA